MSSVLERLPSHTHDLKFSDLLQILRERGLDKTADMYESSVVVECFLHGIDNPLELTVKDIVHLFTSTPDSEPEFSSDGWDHAYRGKAYYRGSQSV